MKVISSLLCMTAILSLTSICQAQSWSIEYGKETGKVSYYNSKSDPNFAEDSPYGPMSFRVVGDNLWVLDSVAGRLICFDKKGTTGFVIKFRKHLLSEEHLFKSHIKTILLEKEFSTNKNKGESTNVFECFNEL